MGHLTKGEGDSERAHKPASNGVFPHVASPLEGRGVSHPIWGMLPFGPICVSFSHQWGKQLEATMRVGKRHVLGPKSHVSIAFWLKGSSPWPWRYGIMSAGHFGQISLYLPLCTILELPDLHGTRALARREAEYCSI